MERAPYPYGFQQRPRFGGQKTGNQYQAGGYNAGYQSGQQVPPSREGIPPETRHGAPRFNFPVPGSYRPLHNEGPPGFTPRDGGPEFRMSPQVCQYRGTRNAESNVVAPQHSGATGGPWVGRPPGEMAQHGGPHGVIPDYTAPSSNVSHHSVPPAVMPHHGGPQSGITEHRGHPGGIPQPGGVRVSMPQHRGSTDCLPQYGEPRHYFPQHGEPQANWGAPHTGMHHQGGPLVANSPHFKHMAGMSHGEGLLAANSEHGRPHTAMPLHEDNRPETVLHRFQPASFDFSALPYMNDAGSVNDNHIQHPLPRNVLNQSSHTSENSETENLLGEGMPVKHNISELTREHRHVQQAMNFAPQMDPIFSENSKQQLSQHDHFSGQVDEFIQGRSSIQKREDYLHQGRSAVQGEGPARFQELHGDAMFQFGDNGPSDKEIYQQWLSSFLSHSRRKLPSKNEPVRHTSVAGARELVYSTLHLVSQLSAVCKTLENCDESTESWTEHYSKAVEIRKQLENKMKTIEEPNFIVDVKRKLQSIRKKRLRKKHAQQDTEEGKEEAERMAEKEARIDSWRMQRIHEVEEKKRERELKAAADGVLAEVRKKQSDAKKMLEVLRSLEKLRKLRKEAAARKGVFPPPSADETFEKHIQRLRTLVRKRTTLYDVEERALKVIVEGEQAEERKRDKEKRQKKEREKFLQKQREFDSVLFGDEEPLPPLHPLQPFRQYYLQAEHSVVSLVQIRHEWDQFLVKADHPDAGSIPRGWVLPGPPANDTWATAMQQIE
ncbi:hypothetical protein XELAEV_18018425mg [Xenopus laevis]|nr:hypothetical protein XELAEV_18018425mg [Xenopus laevis]